MTRIWFHECGRLSLSLLGGLLGRHEPTYEGKGIFLQDSKLYFLRALYTWSQVLNDGTNLAFLDFAESSKT